jgi:hypothetical protein
MHSRQNRADANDEGGSKVWLNTRVAKKAAAQAHRGGKTASDSGNVLRQLVHWTVFICRWPGSNNCSRNHIQLFFPTSLCRPFDRGARPATVIEAEWDDEQQTWSWLRGPTFEIRGRRGPQGRGDREAQLLDGPLDRGVRGASHFLDTTYIDCHPSR